MADNCIICECEAIDTKEWFFNEYNYEFICNFCVKDLHDISEMIKKHG